LAEHRRSFYVLRGKRVFDLCLALPAIVLLAPLFVATALAVMIEDGGAPLFRQIRCGRDGASFQIFKFRSMSPKGGTHSLITTSADRRITTVGHILRKWKLDELPQLLNVVAGDMSFVGPRPEVPRYMAAYDDGDRRIILSVRPGITDYASILFRDENELLAEEADLEAAYIGRIMPVKAHYYRAYVSSVSLATDLRIIAATLLAIVRSTPPKWLDPIPEETDVDARAR
jgi:lipopolysaccharide/colanic/teichoic acid biosynthesis glycosyltransferase